MKVALVYDRVNKWGGAERVLLALHKLFPDAPLYTSVYDSKKAGWAKNFVIKSSFLQQVPFLSSNHEFIPFLMPVAFEHFSFDGYDLVISVTSEAGKGIITKPGTKHICYCLTPTRYLWSGYDEYFKNKTFQFIASPAVRYLRTWDKIAAHRTDTFVAISQEVQKRIKKYYGKDSTVIYPPVTLVNSKSEAPASQRGEQNPKQIQNSKFKIQNHEYFLVVSRFVPYKRIDLAIQACNALRLPLKIVGNGRDVKRLKALAGPTIEFLGTLTDEQLIAYYKNCRALIFPGVEDFGLSVIETQKFGKPVIAFRGGGAVETIREGKTGMFFNKQTQASLEETLRKFDWEKFYPKDCMKQAELFGFQKFKTDFISLVQKSF